MLDNSLILVIRNRSASEPILKALEKLPGPYRVQSVERLPMAQARIAGGGVAGVVIDITSAAMPEVDKLDCFLTLSADVPELPIVVVYESEHESALMTAILAVGGECLLLSQCEQELARTLCLAVEKRRNAAQRRQVEIPESGLARRIIALAGAKGGVGTTTVAVNVAAILSQYSRVILAELLPSPGSLSNHLHLQHSVRNVAHLLDLKPGEIDSAALETCLWPYKSMPACRVLFAPTMVEQCLETGSAHVKAILAAAAALADSVIVDLPAGPSEAYRAALQESAVIGVVVERDAMCVAAAKEMLKAIQFWETSPAVLGAIVVNRVVFASPLELADIELQLGIPILGVIPPAPDLCAAAYKAKCSLVAFDPESLAAQSVAALAGKLAEGSSWAAHRPEILARA